MESDKMSDRKKHRDPHNGRPQKRPARPAPKAAGNDPRTRRTAPNVPQGRSQRQAAAGGRVNGRPPQRSMPQTDRAMNRQMRGRYTEPRRRRKRAGNYILYYLLAAIVIVIVFVVLANTLLFNCSKIDVVGNVRYTADDIIDVSGLKLGDNLLHVNEKAAENRIVDALAYIDIADVSRSFPTGIKISVTEAEKWYCLEQDGKNVCISRGGKIIESGKTAGLPVVKGFDAETTEVGSMLRSSVENKSSIPAEILNAAEKAGLASLDEIDLTDRFSIVIQCDGGRITLETGSVTDIESKLYVAQTLIRDELSPTEEVTILLNDPEKVAVKNKNTDNNIIPVLPDEPEEDTSSEEDTDDNSQTQN